jgi:hypothetical protein
MYYFVSWIEKKKYKEKEIMCVSLGVLGFIYLHLPDKEQGTGKREWRLTG